jgi:hypothetical protein
MIDFASNMSRDKDLVRGIRRLDSFTSLNWNWSLRAALEEIRSQIYLTSEARKHI